MGLDMNAFITETDIAEVDFAFPKDSLEIAYWRKHPNLHGWMEELYRDKGGSAATFNCVNLRLDATDIDALELVVLADVLPLTTGFFFGESTPEDKADDLAFIAKARELLAQGKAVFYSAWW